jgi:hypothetical protein
MHAIELPVDDADTGAEGMQLGCEGEPGRTRADDEDIRFAGCRHHRGSSMLPQHAWLDLDKSTFADIFTCVDMKCCRC